MPEADVYLDWMAQHSRYLPGIGSRRAESPLLRPRFSIAFLAFLFLLACERGEVVLLEPEGAAVPTNSLVLRAELDAGLGLSEADFGWTGGIPGAEATLLRVREFEAIVRTEGATDAAGSVRFEELRGGVQWVTLFRRLEADEAEALGPGWPVAALAGGGKVAVSGATDTSLVLRPPGPGTLVISEVASAGPPAWESHEVSYGPRYIELYNNGRGTVWLDGMLLGREYAWPRDHSRFGHHACSDTEPMRVDPEGLWSARFWRFPGKGTDHPVAPGQTVLIAVSATNHRDIDPILPDLTGADFEFRPGDLVFADNPAAPDLEDVGPEPFVRQAFLGTSNSWFLASPTDLSALPRLKDPGVTTDASGSEYVRIPRDHVLDVTLIWWDNAGQYTETGASPICLDPINPIFDAVPGGFDTLLNHEITAQRRVVRARDGRVLLLDTNVSAIDFVMRGRTPGWVPEVEW